MTSTNRWIEEIAPEVFYALAKTHLDWVQRDTQYQVGFNVIDNIHLLTVYSFYRKHS